MTPIHGRVSCGARAAALTIVLVIVTATGCGSRMFGRVYEYEEDIHVSLDGSADVTVNASIPALVMLRGLELPLDPSARLDRDIVRAAYQSPLTEVRRVSRPWRRQGRQFIQVRVRVSDIRKLSQVPPFSWSTYELAEKDGVVVYKQHVGRSALRPAGMANVGWKGGELVAFKLHLPSRIIWHNARDLDTNEPADIARGNILAWEQQMSDRLDGRPIAVEVRLDRQSILNQTLWLFAGAFIGAVLLIGAIIWWTMLKAPKEDEAA